MPLAVNDKYLKLNQLLLSTIGFIQAICEFFFLDRLRYSKMQKIKNSFYKKKPVHYLSKQGCVITRKKKTKHKGVCWKPKKKSLHNTSVQQVNLLMFCYILSFHSEESGPSWVSRQNTLRSSSLSDIHHVPPCWCPVSTEWITKKDKVRFLWNDQGDKSYSMLMNSH